MDFWETVADTSDPSNAEKKGKLYCLNVSGYGKADSYIKGNEKPERVGFCK